MSCRVNVKYGENNVNVGPLKEIPEICVDHFFGNDLKSTAFFLSHAHTDHMVGLESGAEFFNRLNDPGVKLYCNAVTPLLLTAFPKYLGGEEGQANLIRKGKLIPLDAERPYTIEIPSEPDNFFVTVTLLRAGHCPGSVMFLFETESVRVLHTGDFRLTVDDLKGIGQLHERGDGDERKPKQIDHLYVDTTFCTSEYFPCRKKAIQTAFAHVQSWIKESTWNWIFIKFAAKFAHEYILMELHKTFNKKIHVSPDRHKIYSMIPGLDTVTTLDPRTPFHFCGDRNCVEEGDSIEMRLTSMWYALRSGGARDTVLRTAKKLNVCYAMHSSLIEIAEAIDYLQPHVVTPLVMPFSSNLDAVKTALCHQCSVSFIYEDYRSEREFIIGMNKSATRSTKPSRILPKLKSFSSTTKSIEANSEGQKIKAVVKKSSGKRKIKEKEYDDDDPHKDDKNFQWGFNFSPIRKSSNSESGGSQPNSQDNDSSSQGGSPLLLIKTSYPRTSSSTDQGNQPSCSSTNLNKPSPSDQPFKRESPSCSELQKPEVAVFPSTSNTTFKRKLDFENIRMVSPPKKSPKVSSVVLSQNENVCDNNYAAVIDLTNENCDSSETDFEMESNSSNSQSLLSASQ